MKTVEVYLFSTDGNGTVLLDVDKPSECDNFGRDIPRIKKKQH